MKKIIVIALMILSFGIAKAHMVRKAHPAFTQKKFVVTGINRLKNYDVTFNIYSPPIKRWVKKNQIEITVNLLGVEADQTKISVSSIMCLRLRSGTGLFS